jgi:pyruvate/2-oxoglutarate dehydrogenase complex dihydrolipoamide acyltransferase (E2) component
MSQPIPAPRDPSTRQTTPDLRAVGPAEPAPITVGQLLAWAAAHPEKTLRDHAEKARTHLDALRSRHQADAELTAIALEAKDLEERLAQLRARETQLQPKKARRPRDHEPAAVRTWAKEHGIDCPATGRVPAAVVDQWRTAQAGE